MVEIFKTNIDSDRAASFITCELQLAFPEYHINFDLEDFDNILRVASTQGKINIDLIIAVVQKFGFRIEQLLD